VLYNTIRRNTGPATFYRAYCKLLYIIFEAFHAELYYNIGFICVL